MSLISEALKKARQEASRQDSAQRGVPYAVGGTEPASARSLAAPLVAGIGAGAVLVGALVLAAYFGHWGPWKGRGEAEAVQAVVTVPVGTAPGGPEGGVTGGSASAAGSPGTSAGTSPTAALEPAGGEPRSAAPSPLEAVPSTAPPAPSSSTPTTAQGPAASSSVVAPSVVGDGRSAPGAPVPRPAPSFAPASPKAASTPAAPPAGVPSAPASPPSNDASAPSAPGGSATPPPAPAPEEKVYLRDLQVPGGGTLHLNGVAFSSNPVAVIDGKVVGPGEVVQGFTIVEIQPGRVRLQGHGMNVVVAMK